MFALSVTNTHNASRYVGSDAINSGDTCGTLVNICANSYTLIYESLKTFNL